MQFFYLLKKVLKNKLMTNLYNSFSLNRKDTSPSNFSENSKNRVPGSKGLIILRSSQTDLKSCTLKKIRSKQVLNVAYKVKYRQEI